MMNKPGTTDAKAYIQRLFSQELQYDETPTGAYERNQLKKWLLEWASDYNNDWDKVADTLKEELAH